MQPNKANIKREPIAAEVAAAPRLYEVKHDSCPKRLVTAYSVEEAKSWYLSAYGLHISRTVEVSEVK